MVVMGMLLASLLVAGNAQASTLTTTETRTIAYGDYTVIANFQAGESSFVAFSFEVQLGTSVDVLIMDKGNFDAYSVGSPFSYLPGSALDLMEGAGGDATPDQGTEYYVVIDNTNTPVGGANPTGSVQVYFSVTSTDIDIPAMLTNLMIIVAVAAIAFVVVILVVLYIIFFRKPKPQTPPPTVQPGMRICPYCGTNAPYDFQYCPKCGKKW